MADFEALYIEHFTGVYRFALKLCRDAALAEELTQETFYRAMKGLKGFRGGCSEYAWLCQIAKNAYYSHLRRRQETSVAQPQPDSTDADALSTLLQAEQAATVHRALHRLPDPHKEVFTLRVFAGLPFAEIAALFGKGESWARVVFFRAKTKLADAIKEETSHA